MAFSFRNIFSGIRIVPKSVSTVTTQGDLDVTSGDGKLNYFNGTTPSPIVTESHAATLTNKTIDADLNTITDIDNDDIKAAAGIVYSKLNLTNGIVNADINVAAGIVYSKLNLTNSIVNADINAAAAIAYSKLSLANSIVDSDINTAAAISRSKLASGIANHVIINDGVGAFSSEATLAKSRGGSGQDNSAITFPGSGVLVTETAVETLSNKSFSDSVTIAEVPTPSTPTSGFGRLYFKSDGNAYSLNDSGIENQLLTGANITSKSNFLYNSNFDFWQRGILATSSASSIFYLADRWYASGGPTVGTGGTVEYSRVVGTSNGAKYGAGVRVSVAPSVPNGNGVFLAQTLENFDSLKLYNQTASFRVKVKALGNINQATIQFNYQTSEVRITPGSNIIASTSAVINSATFTTITLSNISLGALMTTNGVIGIAIRATGASAGGLADLNNGFVVEQAEVVLGSPLSTFQSQFSSISTELQACKRYYQKSYDPSVFAGTNTGTDSNGAFVFRLDNFGNSTRIGRFMVQFSTQMFTTPSISIFSTTGTAGTVRDRGGGVDVAAGGLNVGVSSFSIEANLASNSQYFIEGHWTADCDL